MEAIPLAGLLSNMLRPTCAHNSDQLTTTTSRRLLLIERMDPSPRGWASVINLWHIANDISAITAAQNLSRHTIRLLKPSVSWV